MIESNRSHYFSSLTIKIIAITTMIIDHIGAVFWLHDGFRVVGRIAFPLFVFLIADSCRHTKSMEKFLLRLFIFAMVSEVPFDLAFMHISGQVSFVQNTNIFYTLFLGVFCVYIFQKLRKQNQYMWVLAFIPVTLAIFLADWLGTDFGGRGVLFVFLVAVLWEYKTIQLGIIALFMFWLYFPAMNLLIGGLAAVPIAALASGKQGVSLPFMKWLFYVIYPGHLLLLAAIKTLWTGF